MSLNKEIKPNQTSIWTKRLKKARWRLRKDAACCFEQILEAAPYKTAVVQPLATYLTNHLSKTNNICWALLKKPVKLINKNP